MSDDITIGEVARSLARIEEGQKDITSRIDGLTAGFLPRPEWVAWKSGFEHRIQTIEAARAPWWTKATVAIAAVAVVVSIITAALNAIF